MRKRASWFSIAAIGLGLAFLYMPIAILVIYSFNGSRLVTVWAGWSTRWYSELLSNEAMLDAAWTSLRVALISATVATVLGTLAALALVRSTRRSFCPRSSPGCRSCCCSSRCRSTAASGRW
jgi:putrescine transport system permease protein